MKPICSHFLSCAANGFLESSAEKQPANRGTDAATMTMVMVRRMGFFGDALRLVNLQSFQREATKTPIMTTTRNSRYLCKFPRARHGSIRHKSRPALKATQLRIAS